VVLVEYDPACPHAFARSRERVVAAPGDLCDAGEHVGSTAVPGLTARPIIDPDAAVPSAADVPAAIGRPAAAGYHHRGDLGISYREAFDTPPPAPGEAPWMLRSAWRGARRPELHARAGRRPAGPPVPAELPVTPPVPVVEQPAAANSGRHDWLAAAGRPGPPVRRTPGRLIGSDRRRRLGMCVFVHP
jgi:hypothetical protein